MEDNKKAQYLVIAGTNKAGTTALFRYLGDHPEVSVSRYKESRFFYKHEIEAPDVALDLYRQQFLSDGHDAHVFVEASPTYLHGGRAVAGRIKRVIPDAKLLFSLRNPTARVISYFRSAFGQPHVATYGVAFEDFVARAIEAAEMDMADLDRVPLQDRAFRHELTMSRYAGFLHDYLEAFGVEQVRVHFFDSLTSDVGSLMADISRFAGIDPAFYEDYQYRVENQTRLHRHSGLRRLAGRTNYLLEPFLNRFPSVRRAARRLYDSVNVDQAAQVPIPPAAVSALEQYFAPANAELAELMASCYPDQPLPDWLTR